MKFPREYMRRWIWFGQLQAKLPWVRPRRANLIAITFPGKSADIDIPRGLLDRAVLRDAKNRAILWDDSTAFPVKDALRR